MQPSGTLISVGLAALTALSWGSCDILSASLLRTRTIHALPLSILTQCIGCGELLLCVALLQWLWPGILLFSPSMLLSAIALSGGTAICYGGGLLAIYLAFTEGPVSIVSPLISAQGGIALGASLLVLHELLPFGELLLLLCMVVGIILASFPFPHAPVFTAKRRISGSVWALIGATCMAFSNIGIGMGAQQGMVCMVCVVVGYRCGSLLFSVLALFFIPAVSPPLRVSRTMFSANTVLRGSIIGILESFALLLFSFAVAKSTTALASVLASMYPLLPWLWGLLRYHERPYFLQMSGVGLILGSSILLPFAPSASLVFVLISAFLVSLPGYLLYFRLRVGIARVKEKPL